MWYEVIPSILIVGALVWVPHPVFWALNKLGQNGHSRARDWTKTDHDFKMFYRDQRLTGNEYYVRGLEALDDEKQSTSV